MQKSAKNGNDLHDLDFDLVTLRSTGYVDLVYIYLQYEYGDHQRSLRLSQAKKQQKTEMTFVTLTLTL